MRLTTVLLIALVVLVACASLVSARSSKSTSAVQARFNQWKLKYHKHYANAQAEAHALTNFAATEKRVAALNARRSGPDSAVFGLNGLSDLSPKEFAARYLSSSEGAPAIDSSRAVLYDDEQISDEQLNDVPKSFDWRTFAPKSITPVKDQGQCGSCWAFSATEGLESQNYLVNHERLGLAPQQTVDCDTADGGCKGGYIFTAYDYMVKYGVEQETDYPYVSGTTQVAGTCAYNADRVKVHVTGYSYVVPPCNDSCTDQHKYESSLSVAVANGTSGVHGPPAICVDADKWQNYLYGIFSHEDCSSAATDQSHCVQLVGYTPYYWIVRNSWTTDWGLNGYIYLETGHNTCGLLNTAIIPHPAKKNE